MDTAFVRVKRCFALRLKNKVYIQVIRAWNELFRFMALRTRHISFILHLSEVKFTTRTSDSDGHRWTPLGSHGPHRIPFEKWVSADTIGQHLCPLWFSSDFRYSFASNVSYIRWKVLRIEFCLFHRKKYISYGCVLEMYGKKSISTLPNRELGKCNEIRNNRDLISGEV